METLQTLALNLGKSLFNLFSGTALTETTSTKQNPLLICPNPCSYNMQFPPIYVCHLSKRHKFQTKALINKQTAMKKKKDSIQRSAD